MLDFSFYVFRYSYSSNLFYICVLRIVLILLLFFILFYYYFLFKLLFNFLQATINPELGCMQEPANLSLKKDHQFKNTSFKERNFLKPHLENKSGIN